MWEPAGGKPQEGMPTDPKGGKFVVCQASWFVIYLFFQILYIKEVY